MGRDEAGKGKMRNMKFWSENPKGKYHSEHLGVELKIILEQILEKYDGKVWTGCICLRIGKCGWLLRTR
jgi:hypothetical protein